MVAAEGDEAADREVADRGRVRGLGHGGMRSLDWVRPPTAPASASIDDRPTRMANNRPSFADRCLPLGAPSSEGVTLK